MKARVWIAAAALCAGLGSFSYGQITGTITLDGKPPEAKDIDMSGVKECAAAHADPVADPTVTADDKGNLANVIVSIKKEEGQELGGEASKEPAVLDQKGCMYEPHVLAMMAGQEFSIKNDDPFLHNVHSLAATNPTFNFAQPNKDEGKKVDPMKAAEIFRVKCDVHPWMSAYIGVFEHPFFAVTKEDGKYSINTKGLADGDYTLQIWHEKFATTPMEEKISVKDGKATKDVKVKAETAMANPDNITDIHLASATVKGDEKKAC